MSQPKNRQALVDLEYCFNQYFNQYFAPIVDKEYDDLNAKQLEEYSNTFQNRGTIGMYGGGCTTAIMAYKEVKTVGEWGTKNSDYLLQQCNDKIFSNKSVNEDMQKMTTAWTAAIVSEIGIDKYKELSAQVPTGDLASFYVGNRFQTLLQEELARKEMPKSSLEYICRKGLAESLPGFFVSLGVRSSELDEQIKELSKKFYNPSFGENAAAFGLSFVIDTATTRGYGSVKKVTTLLAIDGGSRLVAEMIPSGFNFDESLGDAVWDDSIVIDNIRSSCSGVNPQKSEDLVYLNSILDKRIFSPQFDYSEYSRIAHELRDKFNSQEVSNDRVIYGIEAGLTAAGFELSKDSPLPSWMGNKSELECFTSAASFTAMAMHLKSIGVKEYDFNGKKVTPEQLAQKGYDYSRALRALSISDYSQFKSIPSDHVEDVYDLLSNRSSNLGLNREPTTLGLKSHFSDLPEVPDYVSLLKEQGEMYFAMREKFGDSNTGQMQTANAELTTEQQAQENKSKDIGGWGGLLDNLGLSGIGNVGKNLGYVLAMLPDILIGMFTGKSRNLKFGDNLLPIGAIIAGLFVKNPLLKMLLVGFGGANLLNKAGQEVLENRDGKQTQPVRQYRQYTDEVLDARIRQPIMRGNTLIASIDNVPSVITINDEAVDAYEKGMLPLNTLANAVLRKYDEQKEALEENFDRQQAQDNIVERSRGLK